MLHKNVSPQTLGFVRIWIFALWMWHVWRDPFHLLSQIPIESFAPHGLLRLLPSSLHAHLLSLPFLWGLKGALLVLLGLLILGLRPYHLLAIVTSILLTLYAGMLQGFGPVSHGDLPLLLSAYVLAAFPASDGFSLRGRRVRFASPEVYRAAMMSLTLVFTLNYAGIGIHRLVSGGLGIFTDSSILRSILLRSLEDGTNQTTAGLWAVRQPAVCMILQAGFVVVTIFEALSPFVLFNRRFRFMWLAILVPFHFMTRELMKIFFFWNVMLMPVILLDLDRLLAPRLPRGAEHPVLFFDGECGLCNRFVRWVMAADLSGIFRFAPLQGETARAHGVKPVANLPDEWSLALTDEAGTHHASDATLRVIGRLGAGWNAASLLLWVPHWLRERVYRWVAQNRYRWFGKVPACALLSETERSRLLP